jgi:hypothetical protein
LGVVSFGQYTFYDLEQNNISATLSNDGLFFHNSETSSAGYEAPAGSGTHMIYSMGFWFGGEDVNGSTKLAAQTYTPEGDLFTGPLTTDGAAEYPSGSEEYTVYPVTKAEIDNHIENYDEIGYTTPENILNWPAHGDVAEGVSFNLAPFVDTDGDGVYDPTHGDYPKIKGDEAVYIILNDKADLHETGGDPIGIEVHYLVYQYNSSDWEDATFINMKVINRGTQTLFNFRAACFADIDVGLADNDFVGFNEENNVMYGYNGNTGGGDDVAAVGIVGLNKDARAFATYAASGGATGAPSTSTDYYNYMGAIWPDGTSFTEGGSGHGGTENTNFLYSGNPNSPEEWSELSAENVPGDRRMMMSFEEESFGPFQILCYDFAIVYNEDGDNLENVQNVIDLAGDAIDFYDADPVPYCMSGTVSIEKETQSELSIMPNPSNGNFKVNFEGQYDLNILSLDGRLVYEQNNNTGSTIIDTDLADGTYLVLLKQNEKVYPSKIVIRH